MRTESSKDYTLHHVVMTLAELDHPSCLRALCQMAVLVVILCGVNVTCTCFV